MASLKYEEISGSMNRDHFDVSMFRSAQAAAELRAVNNTPHCEVDNGSEGGGTFVNREKLLLGPFVFCAFYVLQRPLEK